MVLLIFLFYYFLPRINIIFHYLDNFLGLLKVILLLFLYLVGRVLNGLLDEFDAFAVVISHFCLEHGHV